VRDGTDWRGSCCYREAAPCTLMFAWGVHLSQTSRVASAEPDSERVCCGTLVGAKELQWARTIIM
jgi:hypothetical protein